VTILLIYIALVVTAILIHQVISNRRIRMTVEEAFAKIDAATTAAGQRVDALIASIKASGATLTPAQETEASALVAHLTGIAADPANPVPATSEPPAESNA
jgi:hypothetical protein